VIKLFTQEKIWVFALKN